MNRTRNFVFAVLVVSFLCSFVQPHLVAQQPLKRMAAYSVALAPRTSIWPRGLEGEPFTNSTAGFTGPARKSERVSIKEEISDRYQERYLAWKAEFLATEVGRAQWDAFLNREHFTLVITVSNDERNGAGTSKYEWNDAGELVSATISLGTRIDSGYPNPIYYPVMSALAHSEPSLLNGNILAAAKIAHEFGHVKQASLVNGAHYRLQNKLMPEYNKILLSNGRNTNDPKLVDLSHQMGGTPVEIWEDREYWGEANAMLFLRDRITKKSDQRALFTRIIRTVELYAVNYVDRFDSIAQ